MKPPYYPELIDTLRATLSKIEEEGDSTGRELEDLKRRILLLLADLERKKPEKPHAA